MYISDVFFNPITSASTLTTAVTLKMETVCLFVCSFVCLFIHLFVCLFVCSFIQNVRSYYTVYKPKDSHHLSIYDRPMRHYYAVSLSHCRQIFKMEVLLSTVFLSYIAYI
jgi:hypothetical protein